MSITKRGFPIRSLDEWETLAGPKRGYQWKDGRSAKEAARTWLGVTSPALPDEIAAALATNTAFDLPLEWTAEPEARLPFDGLRGEPRNTDLLVRATDARGRFLIAVEAKADEPFGETVDQAVAAARRRLEQNPRSGGVERARRLVASLFGTTVEEEAAIVACGTNFSLPPREHSPLRNVKVAFEWCCSFKSSDPVRRATTDVAPTRRTWTPSPRGSRTAHCRL